MAQSDSSVPSDQEAILKEVDLKSTRYIHDIPIVQCGPVCPYFPLSGFSGMCCNPQMSVHGDMYKGIKVIPGTNFPLECPLPYEVHSLGVATKSWSSNQCNIQSIPKAELDEIFKVEEVTRLYYESKTLNNDVPIYMLLNRLCEDLFVSEESINVMRTAAAYIKMLEEKLSTIEKRDNSMVTKIKNILDTK